MDYLHVHVDKPWYNYYILNGLAMIALSIGGDVSHLKHADFLSRGFTWNVRFYSPWNKNKTREFIIQPLTFTLESRS